MAGTEHAVTTSAQNEPLPALQESKIHIQTMKQRLKNYRQRHTMVIQKEQEREEQAAVLEKRKREEAERLETERQLLLKQLEEESAAQAAKAAAAPSPSNNIQFNMFSSTMSLNDPGFAAQLFSGYPTMVTEQQAIDWLRADANKQQ
ncbi:uncharacterized protein BYT42DRAFT_610626 [Radiomyces spectabilis]|uniref:uncharacterized protein n=1 Tax=Radiomyces spectabilis TaxID=64574 RepID=UPI00221F1D1F|nr:uncharacterized protein BYT42DRAFT_610626 [Radiomyces spectabilis]KAI8391388.1 hypothetical protein BYT42DRAFT_610626 [Radiomyces spectabilis]